MEVLVKIHEEKGLMSICPNTPILVRYEIIGIFAVNCKANGFMTQKIKFSLYGFLFRFFSFFADKTGGNIFFVKPKILLGSLILGLSAGACSTVTIKSQSGNKNDVQSQLEKKNNAQTNANTDRKEIFCYHVEKMPQFPGGEKALMKFINDNLNYPDVIATCYSGVPGRVVLRFVINEDGSVSDIEVVKSLDSFCDREAIRVVELMPKWTPATQNGKACKMYYSLPIYFRWQ